MVSKNIFFTFFISTLKATTSIYNYHHLNIKGDWINNTTYCNGKDSQCTSDIIVTIPKLSLVSPGVVRHDYPQGEAPIVPQVRRRSLCNYCKDHLNYYHTRSPFGNEKILFME